MMWKAVMLVLLIAAPTAQAERGQDLETPGSIFTSSGDLARYQYEVQRALLKDSPFNPYVRMVVMPSWGPEWMIEVDPPSEFKATVRLVEAVGPAWHRGKPREVRARTKTATIAGETADTLRGAWWTMLRRVIPRQLTVGFDGTTFLFGSWEAGLGIVEGEAWSPPTGTQCDALVQLGVALRSYVEGRQSQVTERQIAEMARNLAAVAYSGE
jgi:hypothetical protein